VTTARERRLVFGEVAEQYDRVRPSYPAGVFADALAFARYRDGEQVLEVGAGTGKATAGFVHAGARVVALEPSPAMADVLRARFASPDVEIVGASLESWPGVDAGFALVAAAQSWHWVDPEVGLDIARAALRDDGAIALIWNRPRFDDAALRRALDEVYAALAPGVNGPFGQHDLGRSTAASAVEQIRSSAGFRSVTTREHEHRVTYDAAGYVDLLGTHSDHRLLPPEDRLRLTDRVAELVEAAGGITVDYATDVVLARRA
jgi:SAM-dependent methyltransferase